MYQPGLKGVVAVETELSNIDGEEGILTYRGMAIHDIVQNYSFEEAAFYLLHGTFPSEKELQGFQSHLNKYRYMPPYLQQIIDQLPIEQEMMDVLRTAISAVTFYQDDTHDTAIQLIAMMPTIIACRFRHSQNKSFIVPDNNLQHVENFMYMLTENVDSTHVKMLEAYLIMTMEHGLNASTFAARVTKSTQSDIISAITSAIGTMKGPLHGGAPSGVIDLLNEIETKDNIYETIHSKLKNKERIMGFGHRVYKTVDPRAEALKQIILGLENRPEWIELALQTEIATIDMLKKYKPNQQLYTNVEYYAAAIMKSLEIDPNLFTAIFSSSRIVGWCAHAIEQESNNTIFRPAAKYIGK
ncbi:citrate/2-methylcitrate synthase [Virgibacillus necropolis]|uniref:Citrate synthase n=1 Tax=Virgibacillus necropolis TaxID=163877 RepID=A0A221MD36_9BACI|nr:citrate/2-methylcitrate synthase [Virgibacillus necropolis]ASN05573.1 citrate synthase/methylcitrate synthase [Virgibacillus necropolis]